MVSSSCTRDDQGKDEQAFSMDQMLRESRGRHTLEPLECGCLCESDEPYLRLEVHA